ncbi:MAG: isoprenylcysteine carboxylmethyltransferase family protein [Gemmatimonadota bacterium]|nr:isoprenylcysteine carboxylmethyltransferase family protein [Gemmatimonadota bacterium]MDH5758032.1 isoprenylcysteine carboxylmethyltransferase family protein [Gemmatimonadota bacterium]
MMSSGPADSSATTVPAASASSSAGVLSRTGVLVYAVLAYAVGMAGLVWTILAVGNLVPFGFGPIETSGVAGAMAVNLTLGAIFTLQHTIMARSSFKDWLTRVIPGASERSTFVLMSGLAVALATWLWQPIAGEVWSVGAPAARTALWALYALGWGYLVASTFVTNHFELFGLRQAWLHFRGVEYTPLPFTRRWMYRYSRHPMMVGVLVGLWAAPDMSVTRLSMAGLFTLYVLFGVFMEERDLAARFGDTYAAYRREIGFFFPRLGS